MRSARLLAACGAGLALAVIGQVPAVSVAVPDKWVGVWSVHAGGATVRANGTITMTYQAYYKRDHGLPSFPEIRMKVTSVHGNRLIGRVIGQRESPIEVGSRLTVRQRTPGIWIKFSGSKKTFRFCDRWHRERGDCGA